MDEGMVMGRAMRVASLTANEGSEQNVCYGSFC